MQLMVIVSILKDLLVKRKCSRAALSEKYELSERTITRYIEVLGNAGIPIESRAGIGGGYFLADDYTLERPPFSPAEYRRIAQSLTDTADKYPDGLNQKILSKIKK
jgi:predicted DNA-binding transcriptional regulator YafY